MKTAPCRAGFGSLNVNECKRGGVKRSFTSAPYVSVIWRHFRPLLAGSAAFFVLLGSGLLSAACGPAFPLDSPDTAAAAADTCTSDTAQGGMHGTIDDWGSSGSYDTEMHPVD